MSRKNVKASGRNISAKALSAIADQSDVPVTVLPPARRSLPLQPMKKMGSKWDVLLEKEGMGKILP